MKVIYLKNKMKTNKNWSFTTDTLKSSEYQQQDGREEEEQQQEIKTLS